MKRNTGQNREITKNWGPATQAVRGGTMRSEFGETSEALFLTSGYAYDCAEDAAARFAGEQEGMTYSRLQNPTVQMHRVDGGGRGLPVHCHRHGGDDGGFALSVGNRRSCCRQPRIIWLLPLAYGQFVAQIWDRDNGD